MRVVRHLWDPIERIGRVSNLYDTDVARCDNDNLLKAAVSEICKRAVSVNIMEILKDVERSPEASPKVVVRPDATLTVNDMHWRLPSFARPQF